MLPYLEDGAIVETAELGEGIAVEGVANVGVGPVVGKLTLRV